MTNLLWLIIAGLFLHFWWNSWKFNGRALELALSHCRQLDLQLLDQSIVIRGIWPVLDLNSSFVLRRTYHFEFTSTGEQRYKGRIILTGMNLKSIDLEAYIIPDTDSL